MYPEKENYSLYLSFIAGLVLAGKLEGVHVVGGLGPEPRPGKSITPTNVPISVQIAFAVFKSVMEEVCPREANGIVQSVRVRYNKTKLNRRDLLGVIQHSGMEKTTAEAMLLCYIAAGIERGDILPGNLEVLLESGSYSFSMSGFEEVDEDIEVALKMIDRALNKAIDSSFVANEMVQRLRARMSDGNVSYKDLMRVIPDYDETPTQPETLPAGAFQTVADALVNADDIPTLEEMPTQKMSD